MITPSGKTVRVGYSETELEWIRAASTLSLRDREEAYAQIADMTGRKVSTIRLRGKYLVKSQRYAAKAFLQSALNSAYRETASRTLHVMTPTLGARKRQNAEAIA